jgi:hypothetical protein
MGEDDVVLCPMCRETFGTPDEFDEHYQMKHMSPKQRAKPDSDATDIYGALEKMMNLFRYSPYDDVGALRRCMAMAQTEPYKINMVVQAYENYLTSMAEVDDGSQQLQSSVRGPTPPAGQIKPKGIKFNKQMADWDANDWSEWMVNTQKNMMSSKFQMEMMNKMMANIDMGGAGSKKEEFAKLPPELESELKELRNQREEQRLKRLVEPYAMEIRRYREEIDDAKKTGKNPILSEMMEYAAIFKALDGMGMKEQAESVREQGVRRLEELRLNTEKEIKTAQLATENAKNDAQRLMLEKMQTEFKGSLDLLRKENEIASQSKSQNFLSVVEEAQKVTDAVKKLRGEPEETAEDRRMEAIGNMITGTLDTLKPIINTALSQPRGPGGPPSGYQASGPMPQGQYVPPPAPGTEIVGVHCPNRSCNMDFDVDLSKVPDKNRPRVKCPNCKSEYELEPLKAPMQQMPQRPPGMGLPPQSMMANDARKNELMSLPPQDLQSVALQYGIDPVNFTDNRQLVDAILKASGS